MGKIYEIFGTDAREMTIALLRAAQIEKAVPRGARVALKPNLVIAGTPESGATTHAGVLCGCIEYFQGCGIKDISVIESSWVGDDTLRAAHACGYDRVCQYYQVPFYDLKKDKTRRVPTPLRDMDICEKALDADYLVDLPVLKGHCQTVMTCALKNCKGCLPDREKRKFHSEGLMRPIAALAATLRPELTIVDSICGDLNFEEGGNPVPTNRMFLGTDPVLIDTYGCRLMGVDPADVPYIEWAEKWGAGSTKLSEADIIPLNSAQAVQEYPAPSGLVKRLTGNVCQDSACSACYAALVRGLYALQEEGLRVDKKIAIGQGWRGKAFDGLGIGNCCKGACASLKGCPPTGMDVAAFLKEHATAK